MSDGFRTTNLPAADGDILVELIGNAQVQGIGPLATRRLTVAQFQAQLLGSTSAIGIRFTNIENRLATAEGFTNQIAGLGSRVTTLEGLAGISPGTDLAADGTAVRSTRYWPRPGEAIRTWTAAATATPQVAAPLTVGGAYSITTDGPGKGPALRITGNAYATSIAKTHLDDGEIVEFTFRIARRVDNTGTNAAANNVPVLEFRCYKADLSDNGTVSLPTTALLTADPLRIVTYRACLTLGVGSVDLPANTRFISPLFGERGAGAVELTSADRSTQSLTSAPEMADAIAPEDRLFIFDDSAKLIKKFSFAQLEVYLSPPTFSSEPPGLTADLTSKVILPPDDQRKNFQVQCETHDLAVNWNGRAASFDRDAIVYAGVIPDWSAKGKEAVSVIARPSSLRTIPNATTPAKVWVSQDRLVPGYISGSLFADTVLSNYPDQGLNKAYRGTLRDRINRLNDLGIWDKLTVVIFPVHIIDNLTVNLAKPSVPMVLKGAVDTTTVGKMTVAAYRNWGATGPAAYIDTGLAPSSGLGLSSAGHLMGVQIDGTTLETATGFAGNSPTYYIKPNASATVAGFRSGGTGQDSVPVAAGGWIMGNRIAADTYDLYGEGAAVAKPGTLGTPGERNLFICALNTSNGAASPSTLRARGFVHGFGLQGSGAPAEVRDAFKAIFTAADLASGA